MNLIIDLSSEPCLILKQGNKKYPVIAGWVFIN